MDVNPGGSSRSGKYTLDFQIWRPSPTVNSSNGTGCYSLVGNNRFSAISPLTTPGVARVTPSPEDYISFQPGDVLGVYVEEASKSVDGVVMLTSCSFTSELVWYASIAPTMTTSQNGDCPYSVGSNGVLNTSTHAAPVISISTSKSSMFHSIMSFLINDVLTVTYSCPPELPISPTIPTGVTSPSTEPNGASFSVSTVTTGVIASLVPVIISTIALIVSLAVCLKARKINRATVHMIKSQTHRVTLQDMGTHTEGSTCTYPAVGQADTTKAYATNIVTKKNDAYNYITNS